MTKSDSKDSYANLAPLQSSIMAILRATGGRLLVSELMFGLRIRGLTVANVQSALRVLRQRGFIRGPLAGTLVHELTTNGWDFSRPRLSGPTTQTLPPRKPPATFVDNRTGKMAWAEGDR
jgi:hypothetical protein